MATQHDFFMFQDDYYKRLGEASDMSVESTGSIPMSMSIGGNNSVSMLSQADSSVGSNGGGSLRTRLMHDDLRTRNATRNASVSHSVVMPGIVSHTIGEDILASALMDPRFVSVSFPSRFHLQNPSFCIVMHNSLAYTELVMKGFRLIMDCNCPSLSSGFKTWNGTDFADFCCNRYPTEGLEGYDDWTIDLRRLHMGPPFAQGAFGRLYKGTYNGEDVAVKILERPENNVETMLKMESAFAKEVTMLAAVKHQNVVRFIGACRKPMVWCIVTEYARGGSVRSFLSKRQSRAVPLKLAVKQAQDVARGMEYLHSLDIIHRDLKSDNLLIATDKSIKIADFGAARIEVQVEGMTPETGTYRWMAP